MARHHKRTGGKGWKANNKDGKLLYKLLKKGLVQKDTPPGAVKEKWPQFRAYKDEAFAGGLRRMKHKMGLLVRDPMGKLIDSSRSVSSFVSIDAHTLCFFRLIVFFYYRRSVLGHRR